MKSKKSTPKSAPKPFDLPKVVKAVTNNYLSSFLANLDDEVKDVVTILLDDDEFRSGLEKIIRAALLEARR